MLHWWLATAQIHTPVSCMETTTTTLSSPCPSAPEDKVVNKYKEENPLLAGRQTVSYKDCLSASAGCGPMCLSGYIKPCTVSRGDGRPWLIDCKLTELGGFIKLIAPDKWNWPNSIFHSAQLSSISPSQYTLHQIWLHRFCLHLWC